MVVRGPERVKHVVEEGIGLTRVCVSVNTARTHVMTMLMMLFTLLFIDDDGRNEEQPGGMRHGMRRQEGQKKNKANMHVIGYPSSTSPRGMFASCRSTQPTARLLQVLDWSLVSLGP